jgi:hypothetical protein
LYLQALALFQRFTEPGRDAAIALLIQALAIDPSYTPAAAASGGPETRDHRGAFVR